MKRSILTKDRRILRSGDNAWEVGISGKGKSMKYEPTLGKFDGDENNCLGNEECCFKSYNKCLAYCEKLEKKYPLNH